MAEVACSRSFSKEESNMAADQALLKNSSPNIYGDIESSRCDRCKSKKKKVSVVCSDCGDLYLCSECNRLVHQDENTKIHKFHHLKGPSSKTKSTSRNGYSNNDNIIMDHSNNANIDVPAESLLLIDGSEKLKVLTDTDFMRLLKCEQNPRVKVVSVFGNTGDGKSHTLNHTFFTGADIFDTSPSQKSCTVGVWAAYDSVHKAIILDTEGLLGVSENANQRMRLLLKILAISDVVIYRTRAERLHSDMFTFLGDASEAYMKYFNKDLQSVKERRKMKANAPLCNLGPSIIIFQETHYTMPLGHENGEVHHVEKSPEEILRENFANIGRNPSAFSSISYVGTRTQSQPTDFSVLLKEVQLHLKNSAVRSARPASVIFNALLHLNTKFGDEIDGVIPNSFPDEYFTCTFRCQSCSLRCEGSMNHEHEGKAHSSSHRCKYQAQYENKVYICKICHEKGVESIVCPKTSETQDTAILGIAKYAWSGYVLECPECGVIYRSRQYWYGNRDPVENSVRIEILHCWPGTRLPHSHQNAARRIIDGMHSLATKITDVSAKPAKAVTNWVTDKVAPSYWTPNYLIFECTSCSKEFDEFEQKHHCRACGLGFCDNCTHHRVPVSDRGWGDTPVRVCNSCFEKSGLTDQANAQSDNIDVSELLEALGDDPALETGEIVSVKTSQNIPVRHPPELVTTRKVTETVHSTLSYLTSTLEYPLEYLLDSARPDYWVPDSKIIECFNCKNEFKNSESKHHCRNCGNGICDACSKQRLPVPSRGWDYPVRVCDVCSQKKGPL